MVRYLPPPLLLPLKEKKRSRLAPLCFMLNFAVLSPMIFYNVYLKNDIPLNRKKWASKGFSVFNG